MNCQVVHLDRRLFLKATGSVASGLVLGLNMNSTSAAATDAHNITGWILVHADNSVTIYTSQSEMGQGVLSTLPAIVAEELEVPWESVKVEMPDADPKFRTKRGRRVTGNSESIMLGFTPMRTVGAAAREMLIQAAANRWGADTSQCQAADGAVSHLDGRAVSYGELAEEASKLPVPDQPKLKDAANWNLIGKSLPRKDVEDKVLGRTVYGIDIDRDGLLVAAISACPTFGGKLASVKEGPAMAVPGVVKVVRLEDAVAVIADSYWHAQKGLDALDPQWDITGLTLWSNESVEQALSDALASPGNVARGQGDMETAFNQAQHIVEADYQVPYLAHLCMEPMNATVWVRDDGVEIWAPTQSQTDTVNEVAAVTGLSPEKVILHTTMMGGGFGRRSYKDFCVQAAKIALQSDGAPVKLIWSREEDVQHDYFRPAMAAQYRGALDQDNNVSALEAHISGQSLTEQFGLPPTLDNIINTTGSNGDTYTIPNLLLKYSPVTLDVPYGIWRSVILSQNGFFAESFVDELAHTAGISPFALRQKLSRENPVAVSVLEALGDLIDLTPRLDGTGIGFGLVMGWQTTCAVAVELSVDEDKYVDISDIVCVVNCGTAINPEIVEQQMQGGIHYGLSAALWGKVTLESSRVAESNFHDHPVLRFDQAPPIRVRIMESSAAPGGVGEIATAAIAPALTNAIFDAVGDRIRSLPIASSGYDLA